MSEVRRWLESLKLSQYFKAFQNQRIDSLYKCSLLCEEDFDALGIDLPGHRKRILNRLPKHTSLTCYTNVTPKKPARRFKSQPNPFDMATNSDPPPPGRCQNKEAIYANEEDGDDIYRVPPSPVPIHSNDTEDDNIYQNFDSMHSKKDDQEPPPLPNKTKKKSQSAEGHAPSSPVPEPVKPVPAPRGKKPVPKPRTSINKNRASGSPSPASDKRVLEKIPSISLSDVTIDESSDYETSPVITNDNNNATAEKVKPPDLPAVPSPITDHNNIESPKYECIEQPTGADGDSGDNQPDSLTTNSNDSLNQLVLLPPSQGESPAQSQNLYTQEPSGETQAQFANLVQDALSGIAPSQPPPPIAPPPNISERVVTGSDLPDEEYENQSNEFREGASRPPTTGGGDEEALAVGQEASEAYEGIWKFGEKQLIKWDSKEPEDEQDEVPELSQREKPSVASPGKGSRESMNVPPPKYAPPPLPNRVQVSSVPDDAPPPAVPPRPKPKMSELPSPAKSDKSDASLNTSRFSQLDPFTSFQRSFSGDDPFQKPDPFSSFDESYRDVHAPAAARGIDSANTSRDSFAEFDAFTAQRLRQDSSVTSTPRGDDTSGAAGVRDTCDSGASGICGSAESGKGGKAGRLSQENIYSPYPMPPQSPSSACDSPGLYAKPQKKPPKPPPKTENPFMDMYDRKRGTYVLESELSSSRSFEEKASVWESDDTLSDGGDFLESVDVKQVRRRLQKQSSIPIVPAVSNRVNTRSGHLYKYASKRTSRYMGSQWIKRWVIFENGEFRYYSTNKSKISKRVIPLVTMLHIEQDIKQGEHHPCRFTIITIDRRYTFAMDDADDLTMWTSILMQSIIEAEPVSSTFQEGGDMHLPDKEGFVRMEGIRGKRYLAIKKEMFCYYNTFSDFKVGSPIHKIEMKLASAKDLNKGNKLQLSTPYASYTFVFDSHYELDDWKNAFEEAIAEGLGDDTILADLYENSSNSMCADCGAPDPHWASVNFFITLCKMCAGIHRTLHTPRSKIRSLRMDFKVWTPPLLNAMKAIGNDNSNNFWEWNAVEDDKIDSDSDMPSRKDYILNKYEKKRYCRFHPLHTDQTALNEALCKQVMFEDVIETMHLVFSGADISYASSQYSSDNETAIKIARRAKLPLQVEFLLQNGAEGSGNQPLSGSSFRSPPVDISRSGVTMKGFLHKTGSNPKGDFLRRWVVLENGRLNYFENEKSSVAKDTIEKKEILSLTKTSDDRFEFAFEIGTTKYGGRVYLFAADTSEDRTKWILALAKIVAPVTPDSQDKMKDLDKGGVIFLRDGATNKWKGTWIQLKHKTLALYDEDKHVFEEFDLRKAKSITQLHETERCLEAFDEGQPFVVDFPSRALYMQGDTRRETETWYSALREAVTTNNGKLEDQQLTPDDIPIAIEKCISYVTENGMQVEGIYRLNGQHSKISKLLDLFTTDARGVHLSALQFTIHDVATTLKRFLRSLEDPLLTTELYPKWVNTATFPETETKVQWYKYLLGELPKVNYNTLRKIVFHLIRVSALEDKNKMSIVNLASIFGPVSLKLDKDSETGSGFGATNQEIAVIKDILENHKALFEFKEEEDSERRKEEKLDEARKKWEQLQKSVVKSEDMQLYFTIDAGGDKEPEEYPCKVSPDMLAEDVLDNLKRSAKLSPSVKWGLFEQICDDELVRPVHHREKVLEITKRWGNWTSPIFKKNAKLAVMKNYMYEKMELIFEPTASLFSELKYTEEKLKKFKKVYFQFGQYKLSYQKDTKATQPTGSWNAEDLLLFLGIQHKRSPPTKFGFSFIKNVDNPSGNYFGHAVSCNSEEELYRWVAGILFAQHPGGLEPGNQASGSTSPGLPTRRAPPPPGQIELPERALSRNSSSKRSIIQRIFKK